MTARVRIGPGVATWLVLLAVAVVVGTTVAFVHVFAPSTLAPVRSFYVDPAGDDSADGRSTDRAWRTLQRANAQRLRPGDRVLLAGGAEFTGPLEIGADDAGDAGRPVIVESYGPGRARIRGQAAVQVHNTAGVVLRRFDAIGAAKPTEAGISVYSSETGGGRHRGITISEVTVAGFDTGIAVGAADGAPGFAEVRVRDSVLHDNVMAGLLVFGPPAEQPDRPTYAHADVMVTGVESFANSGDPETTQNSGSGIVFGSVEGGRIADCTAHGNGVRSTAFEGPIGIWVHNSTRIVMEHNLSYGNRTQEADGGGFGLDQNTTDSVVQRNLSYDNDGAGVLVFAGGRGEYNMGNTVRYNISSDDGKHGGYLGGITLIGRPHDDEDSAGVRGVRVYQNTVTTSGPGHRPALLLVGALRETVIANNILQGTPSSPAVTALDVGAHRPRLVGNAYATEFEALVSENELRFGSLAEWRAATGVESDDGAPTGRQTDPGLVDARPPTQLVSARQLALATGFTPRPGSPMISGGTPLSRSDIADRGGTDFLDAPLVVDRYDIGAVQWPGTARQEVNSAGR